MDYVFDLQEKGKRILYAQGGRIIGLMPQGRLIRQAAVLQEDFLADLTAALHGGRVYYAYHSLEHRVVLHTLEEDVPLPLLSDVSGSRQYGHLALGGHGGRCSSSIHLREGRGAGPGCMCAAHTGNLQRNTAAGNSRSFTGWACALSGRGCSSMCRRRKSAFSCGGPGGEGRRGHRRGGAAHRGGAPGKPERSGTAGDGAGRDAAQAGGGCAAVRGAAQPGGGNPGGGEKMEGECLRRGNPGER